MSTLIALKILIVLLAFLGFCVAKKIHKSKKKGKPFVCPMNFDCHKVTTSEYSKLFGVPLEYLGMLYYAIIFIAYLIMLAAPHLMSEMFTQGIIVLSIVAFVFSFFLTYVQAVKIREWCSWCLVSALISTTIIILVLWLNFV